MSKFIASQIKFDKVYLNKLTGDPNSGISKQTFPYHLALHPAQLNDFGQSIQDELDKKVTRYDKMFQGIILGYEKVKLQSDLGIIGPDNLYIHIDLQADFFIFRPELGMILKGIVTKTTKDHVGCLIYSIFNVSLPKPVDDDEDDDDDKWLGNSASKGSDVVFKIIHVDLHSRLPYIKGEIISVSDITKNMLLNSKEGKKQNKKTKFDESSEEEDNTTPQSKKKHRKKEYKVSESMENLKIKEELEIEEEIPRIFENIKVEENDGMGDSSSPSKKKHKKKIRMDKEISEESQENVVEEEVVETVKKHKKKQETEGKEQDHEVVRKKEKRRENKLKQEQAFLDGSLESLDMNALFGDSSVNLKPSTSMANNEDRGKKRRKSNSVSQEVYLDKVKLEEDSELETIIRGKKKKRSKSVSN